MGAPQATFVKAAALGNVMVVDPCAVAGALFFSRSSAFLREADLGTCLSEWIAISVTAARPVRRLKRRVSNAIFQSSCSLAPFRIWE